MNFHLIRDQDCPLTLYKKVLNQLTSTKGLITFHKSLDENYENEEEEEEEENTEPCILSFEELFNGCEAYRKKHQLPNDIYVFLLTGANNYCNWFSNTDYMQITILSKQPSGTYFLVLK